MINSIKEVVRELLKYIVALLVVLFFLELLSFVIIKSSGFSVLFGRKPSGFFVSDNAPNASYIAYEGNTDNIYTRTADLIVDDNAYVAKMPVEIDKSENVLRVLLEGGSAAWGSGQTDISGSYKHYFSGTYSFKSSIAGMIEAKLQKAFPQKKIEVVNAAVVGHTIYQHYAKFMAKDHLLKPDIVIVFAGHNDAQNIVSGDFYSFSEKEMGDYIALEAEQRLSQFPFTISLANRIINKMTDFKSTAIQQTNDEAVGSYTQQDTIHSTALQTNIYSQHTSELYAILDAYASSVTKRNGLLLFCLQPMLYRSDVQKQLSTTEIALKKSYQQFYQPTIPYFIGEEVAPRIDSIMRLNNSAFLDMQKAIAALESNKEVYLDYCHLTHEANLRCASLIADTIVAKVKKGNK